MHDVFGGFVLSICLVKSPRSSVLASDVSLSRFGRKNGLYVRGSPFLSIAITELLTSGSVSVVFCFGIGGVTFVDVSFARDRCSLFPLFSVSGNTPVA